jgi:membrane-associated phospholipid phosphatase
MLLALKRFLYFCSRLYMKRKFWLVSLLLILILTALCLLRVSSFKQNEQDVIANLQTLLSPGSVMFFQIVSDYGKYVNLGLPIIFLITGLVTNKQVFTRNALIILLAMGLSGLIAQSIKRTVKEPRPYEVDVRIKQWSVGGSNSFPSGHTAEVSASMLGITLLLFRTPLSIVLCILWTLLMMSSRIVLGVHNFTDIAGGFVTACLGLIIIYSAFERFWQTKPEPLDIRK